MSACVCKSPEEAIGKAEDVHWLHSGKPWVGTWKTSAYQVMLPINDYECTWDKATMQLTSASTLMVRGQAVFMCPLRKLMTFSRRKRWHVCFFKLNEPERVIGEFDPCLQEIDALDGRLYTFWDPSGGRSGRACAMRPSLPSHLAYLRIFASRMGQRSKLHSSLMAYFLVLILNQASGS